MTKESEAFALVNRDGLLLVGCGKMGSALLKGWLAAGVKPTAVSVLDPNPSDWLKGLAKEGLRLNEVPEKAAVCLLAVKPQVISDVIDLAQLRNGGTTFVSVAAGTTLAKLAEVIGPEATIVRSMPNTPAAIGQGITALVGNAHCDERQLALADVLLQAVGQTIVLTSEEQMDAVTGVSGSGPAYVFHMIEALAEAGEAEGLAPDIAMKLAIATVAGAGALAQSAEETPKVLRENVTSPAGTTAAGLRVLMSSEDGLRPLMRETVTAATVRSRELA
ncbi:MAG: pyrroline-5-carboxylate reductase [Pseudomonadota bacterium]